MNSIVGYKPDVRTLPQLLDWLNDLDKGWLAVLRSQVLPNSLETDMSFQKLSNTETYVNPDQPRTSLEIATLLPPSTDRLYTSSAPLSEIDLLSHNRPST